MNRKGGIGSPLWSKLNMKKNKQAKAAQSQSQSQTPSAISSQSTSTSASQAATDDILDGTVSVAVGNTDDYLIQSHGDAGDNGDSDGDGDVDDITVRTSPSKRPRKKRKRRHGYDSSDDEESVNGNKIKNMYVNMNVSDGNKKAKIAEGGIENANANASPGSTAMGMGRFESTSDGDVSGEDHRTNVGNDMGLLTQSYKQGSSSYSSGSDDGNDNHDNDDEKEDCQSKEQYSSTYSDLASTSGNHNNVNGDDMNGATSPKLQKPTCNDEAVQDVTPKRSGKKKWKLKLLGSDDEELSDVNADENDYDDYEHEHEHEHRHSSSSSNHQHGHRGTEGQQQQDNDENPMLKSPTSSPSNYMKKVDANRRRNAERLVELGLVPRSLTKNVGDTSCTNDKYGSVNDEFGHNIHMEGNPSDEEELSTSMGRAGPLHSGMLFATKYNGLQSESVNVSSVLASSSSDQQPLQAQGEDRNHAHTSVGIPLEEQYPHRKSQIVFLRSCFMSTVRQVQNDYGDDLDDHGNDYVYIPPPILVSGTSGTGKTSIVRGILEEVKRKANLKRTNSTKNSDRARVGVAYLNCSTCERYGSGAGALLEVAYDQLEKQLGSCFERQNGRTRSKKRKKSTEKPIVITACPASKDILPLNNGSMNGSGNHLGSISVDAMDDMSIDSSLGVNSFDARGDDDNDDSILGYGREDEEDWIENRRKKYVDRTNASVNSISSSIASRSQTSRSSVRRSSRVEKNKQKKYEHGAMPKKQASAKASPSKKVASQSFVGTIQTPVAFGRSISQFCGSSLLRSGPRRCAFLILDHADKLLSFAGNKQKSQARTNWLSQLLLLPKVMNLNLSIIAISSKSMLEHTRLNNTEYPVNKFALIDDGINPLRCHFSAYRGQSVFRDILLTPHMQAIITGNKIFKCHEKNSETQGGADTDGSNDRLSHIMLRLYTSLVDIVTQSVESATRDVREISRLARMLWPIYISFLGRHEKLANECLNAVSANRERQAQCVGVDSNIGTTLASPALVRKMGQDLRPYVKRMLSQCLMRAGKTITIPTEEITFCHSLPYLTKFLLLAGYLCQHNKADHDRNLYTNQAKGKKRTKGKARESHGESLTHASSKEMQHHLKSDKVYSFPLERMFSVFSSICNRYACGIRTSGLEQWPQQSSGINESAGDGDGLQVSRIGTNTLLASLSELRHMGLIKEASSLVSIDTTTMYSKSLTSAKYTCELSSHEAELIAKSVEFPLSRYLVANK